MLHESLLNGDCIRALSSAFPDDGVFILKIWREGTAIYWFISLFASWLS